MRASRSFRCQAAAHQISTATGPPVFDNELAEAVTGLASGTEKMHIFVHLMGDFPASGGVGSSNFERPADEWVLADRGIEDVNHKPNPAFSCSFV